MTVVTGSTISTLLHDRINPKDCQVLSLGDSEFLQFFRVVSSDYGKLRGKDPIKFCSRPFHLGSQNTSSIATPKR